MAVSVFYFVTGSKEINSLKFFELNKAKALYPPYPGHPRDNDDNNITITYIDSHLYNLDHYRVQWWRGFAAMSLNSYYVELLIGLELSGLGFAL